jgi:hypothetical protein
MAQTSFYIGCDANRIEAKVQSTYVTFFLLGYFLDEDAVFFDNGIEKTTVPGSWYDILCSEVAGGSVAAFIERSSPSAVWLRKKGSTDYLINPTGEHSGLVVGLDENKYFQAYTFPETTPHFYLIGYLKSGKGLFKTNRPDITNMSRFDQWVNYNLKTLDPDCPYDISFEGYISSTGLSYFNLVGYFLGANPAVIIEAYSVFMSAGIRKPGSTDEYIAAVYEVYHPVGVIINAVPGGQPYIKRLGGTPHTRFNQGVW